jgi:hypothetical protein
MIDFSELQEELRRRGVVTHHAVFTDRSRDVTLRFYRIHDPLSGYSLRVTGAKNLEVTGTFASIRAIAAALIADAVSVN